MRPLLVSASLAVVFAVEALPQARPAHSGQHHRDAQAARDPESPQSTPRRVQTSTNPGMTAVPWRTHATPIASYRLEARLDSDTHQVFGKGQIEWTNPSELPTEELYFHLYLNAFANEETLFLRSPFGAGRSGEKATEYGSIVVKQLRARALSDDNLWQNAEPHSPGDPKDKTDIRVPLPEPILAGDKIVFEIEFEAKLPKIVERTGYVDGYHFVAQWFPKLAKREPDGTWAHFPFHPQAEFYADFGDYDVTLDLPKHLVVGATGEQTEDRVSGDRRRLRYVQKSVHDFAWVAWDGFSSHSETLLGVDVRLLYPTGLERAREATFDALRGSLPELSRRFGSYPYRTLTVVHPPDKADASGGMEYPTLITTGGRSYTSLLGIRDIETVTVHELAHQWFYGLLASDEHHFPFLDEGLTSYAESQVMQGLYGSGSLWHFGPIRVSARSFTRAFSAAWGRDDIVGQPARQFATFGSLGALVYSRTATAFDTLGSVYGARQLDGALRHYAKRYRFAHPTPDQLLATLSERIPPQALENLRATLFKRASVDYLVASVQSVPRANDPRLFDNRAVIVRRGELQFPVSVELVFSDGSRVRQHWDGKGATFSATHSGPQQLLSAVVDPEHRVLLDDNLLNNAASIEPSRVPLITERLSFWAALAQHLLGP